MNGLSLLVIGAKSADLREFAERNPNAFSEVQEIRMAALPGTRYGGYAAMGNKWKKEALGDIIGLVHADTIFEAGALTALAAAAIEGAVTGMVGASFGPPVGNVWGCHLDNPGEVSTLDSCSVFLRRDASYGFDERTFDGFHCAVEDLCLAAKAKGARIVVPPVKANHDGRSTFNPAWRAEYETYRKRLVDKWAGTEFVTT